MGAMEPATTQRSRFEWIALPSGLLPSSSAVLFCEQVKLRAEIRGKDQETNGNISDKEESQSTKEIRILKKELENIKANMQELQRDYTDLQREYGHLIHKKQRKSSGWTMMSCRKIRTSSFLGSKIDGEEARFRKGRSMSTTRQRVSLQQQFSVSEASGENNPRI